MTDYIQAWQCIGCGKIEAPQTCIGVCRDRKILMVGKDDHDAAIAELTLAQQHLKGLQAVLLQLAWSEPRHGQWEQNWRALQERARQWIANPQPEHAADSASDGD
ncbi:hypothetical protein [Dyella sp. A6]|uniref:hypothetical protein n=1 Tax=Dyella aluminiiresistens TaxID=3069105 RepID=UPI002E75AC18|nr:hypothetical protein [Dyella sp. A6]